MKIIQLTDTHIVPDGGQLFESDPAARLRAAIKDINAKHADADLCVLSGDLTHNGDREAYATLRDILEDLQPPRQLVVGNHDDRTRLCDAFPEVERTKDGFLQSFRDMNDHRLIFLDTIEPGVHTGAFCEKRASWLSHALSDAGERGVLIFMHHPPTTIRMPKLDAYRILDAGPLQATLAAHKANVRHIFFGHIHRPLAGSWHGIPISATKGTNHQSGLDFSAGSTNTVTLEPASYAVIFVDSGSVIVHFDDFSDTSPRFVYDPSAAPDKQIQRL